MGACTRCSKLKGAAASSPGILLLRSNYTGGLATRKLFAGLTSQSVFPITAELSHQHRAGRIEGAGGLNVHQCTDGPSKELYLLPTLQRIVNVANSQCGQSVSTQLFFEHLRSLRKIYDFLNSRQNMDCSRQDSNLNPKKCSHVNIITLTTWPASHEHQNKKS